MKTLTSSQPRICSCVKCARWRCSDREQRTRCGGNVTGHRRGPLELRRPVAPQRPTTTWVASTSIGGRAQLMAAWSGGRVSRGYALEHQLTVSGGRRDERSAGRGRIRLCLTARWRHVHAAAFTAVERDIPELEPTPANHEKRPSTHVPGRLDTLESRPTPSRARPRSPGRRRYKPSRPRTSHRAAAARARGVW